MHVSENIFTIILILTLCVIIIAGFYISTKTFSLENFVPIANINSDKMNTSIHQLLINYVSYLHEYMLKAIGASSSDSKSQNLVPLVSKLYTNQTQIAQELNTLYPNMYSILEPQFQNMAGIYIKLLNANIKRNIHDIDQFTNDLANNTKNISLALHRVNPRYDYETLNTMISRVTIALNFDMGIIMSSAPDANAYTNSKNQAIALADFLLKNK